MQRQILEPLQGCMNPRVETTALMSHSEVDLGIRFFPEYLELMKQICITPARFNNKFT
jgi:hypothetical protein